MALPSPPNSQPIPYSPIARNTHIFQPPKSPASTAATPLYATSSDYFTQNGSRKRSRPDSSSHPPSPLHSDRATTPSWAQTPGDSILYSGEGSGYGHNSLLVNERYRLDGGYDTPGIATNTELDTNIYHDEGRRWIRDRQPSFRISGPALSGPLAKERNGVARMASSPNGTQSTSWTRLAFTLVGKAFTFGSSVFKGFYSGGGTPYHISEKRLQSPNIERASTPFPGSWSPPAPSPFLGDFEQDNPHPSPLASTSRPPNKRRQTDKDAWVLVGTPDFADASPKRKNANPASRASSRRSLLPPASPRRQTSFVAATGSPDRRASFAPTRSPGSRPSTSGRLEASTRPLCPGRPSTAGRPTTAGRPSSAHTTGALSPEAEKFVYKRARQERKADKAMNSMGRQLEELIRMGQEALGTRVEVEGGEDDEMEEGW